MTKKNKLSKEQKDLKKLHSLHKNIYSQEEFKDKVNSERIRSDRNESTFSIVVLKTPQSDFNGFKSLTVKISEITRSIDSIGWYEGINIAVLLPDTGKEGAHIFGDKIKKEFQISFNEEISYVIYSYPEHWLANESIFSNDEAKLNKSSSSTGDKIDSLFIYKMPLWKRTLDLIVASAFLLVISPILLLVCIYIKLVSPGPVFFKQTRIGYEGYPFIFYKFRTMKFDNNESFHGKHSQSFIKDGDIPMEKLDNRDPRIFTGGRLIRKSCLDELPQLWNIIKGDMSLVGPRPCIPYEAEEYLRWHTHRFDTVPGLSGLWQVSGKNKLTFKQMIRLDISYCQNMSLLSDLLIIFKTPIVIFKMVMESVTKHIQQHVEEASSMDNAQIPNRKVQ